MKHSQAGQALLVVVLVMVIALTVGLSVVSRSITNLRTSTEEENSQRAFSAAEAGVEQALRSNQEITSPQSLANDSSIQEVKIQPLSGKQFLLNGGAVVPKDDGVDVWLSSYSATDPSQLYQNPYIVKHVVTNTDEVVVDEQEDEGTTFFTITVAKDDMGKVIGKEGRVIRAIRNVMKIPAIKQGKRIQVSLADASSERT